MAHKGVIFTVVLLVGMWMHVCGQDSLLVLRTLDSIRSMPNDTLKVHRLLAKSKNFFRFFDRRGQENPFLQEAIALSHKIRYNKGLSEAYNELGTAKRNKSQYILAADYHERALRFAEEIRDDRLTAISLNNMGVDYRRRDMLQKAFEVHFRALKTAEKIKDVRNITIAINSIGNIQLSAGKYRDAIEEFTKSLRLEEESNNPLGVAINLGNLGYAYEGLGQLDKAIEYYNRSLAVNQQIDDLKGQAICYNCLGTAYQKKKNYPLAKEYMQKALVINDNDRVKDKIHLAESYLSIGRLLNEENKLEEGRGYIRQSIDLGLHWGFKSILQDAYKALGENFHKAGEYDSSINNTNISLLYKDSLLEEKSTTEFAQMQAMYDVHQKDNQIRLLQQEQDINQLRIRRNLALAIALAGFLFMLIVGGFFYIRHRNLQANRQTLQLELRSLRSQMNPHFIFNSLSSIHRYIWSNNQEEASDYLTKFSKLMRMILDNSQHTFIPLNRELDSLRLYLDLEALRCNNIFDYRIQVAENINDEEVLIPPMIIQPYVENAIWHGLVHRKEKKGRLDINVSLNGKVLEVMVTDNGIGRKMAMEIKEKKDRTHNSMGMKVTEGRIALIRKINNTKDANVEVHDLEDHGGQAAGTQVRIKLPAEFLF
ncbi:tetratricopeptide repeat-containing sensor histidine kinase [Chitinophaga cymbidii]|nr:tetratricopeptide repeat protein [Chitinophaga cymbidii]